MEQPKQITKNYFGYIVTAFKNDIKYGLTTPYPWWFTVQEPNGTKHRYAGIPNQCATARSALKRGWYRAKWMKDGTYNKRYYKIV